MILEVTRTGLHSLCSRFLSTTSSWSQLLLHIS